MTAQAPAAIREPASGGLAGRLLVGTVLAGSSNVINRGMLFVGTAALARLLGPHAMGVGNLALVLLGAIILTANRGVPQSVVRMRGYDMGVLTDTGFYLMIVFGVALTALFAASAPLLALAFEQPQLTHIMPVLSLAILAFALSRIHSSIMDRQLHYWRRFIPLVVAPIAFIAVSIPMAAAHFGVWALIAGHLAYWTAWTINNFLATGWLPGRRFSWPVAREMLGFTRDLTITGIASYGFRNIDNLAVARFIGAGPLGLYSVAFNLASAPSILSRPVGDRVLFPVFAAAQDDRAELLQMHRLATRLFTAMGMLSGAVLVTMAPNFIHVIYGDEWLEAILPLQILAIQGAIATITLPNIPVLTALNRRRDLYPVTFSTLGLLAVLVYPGTWWGLPGVSVAACIAWVVGSLASIVLVARVLAISSWTYLRDMWNPLVGSVLCVIPTVLLPNLLLGYGTLSVVGLARLGLQGGAAVALFGLWLLATDRQVLGAYRQLRRIGLRARWEGRAPRADEGLLDSIGPEL